MTLFNPSRDQVRQFFFDTWAKLHRQQELSALEKMAVDPHRDRAQMLKVENVQQAWQQWLNKLPPARRDDDDVREIRWMIEELRVSFFAQQLGTPYPISDKRILQAMEQISG